MGHPFDPDTLTLPRVKAHEAVTLAQQLVTAAQNQTVVPGLPKLIDKSVTSLDTLGADLKKQIGVGPAAGTPTKEQADDDEDDGVRALDGILAGWEILAKHGVAEGQTAANLRARLFNEGIKFITGRYEAEWAQVETKLTTITDEKLDAAFASLGMTAALDYLRAVHKVYGSVLGTAAPLPEPPEVGAARQALVSAIRLYVVRVVGNIDEDDPTSQTLADVLLLPLEEWRTIKNKKAAKAGATSAAASGATGTTGASGPQGPTDGGSAGVTGAAGATGG